MTISALIPSASTALISPSSAPSSPSSLPRAATSSSPRACPDDAVEIRYSADMRYLDQIYEVTVPVPDLALPDDQLWGLFITNFHSRYQELYSYAQQDQEVRLITLRVAAMGKLPRISQLDRSGDDRAEDASAAEPTGSRRVYLGRWHDAPTYAAGSLPPGTGIDGPAILESEFTTILVWPGDHATVDSMGGIALACGARNRRTPIRQSRAGRN